MIIEFTQIIALALLIPIIYSIIKNKEITIKYKVSYTILYILVILIFLTITPKITGIFNPAKSSVTYIPSAIAGYKGPIMGLLGYIRKHVYAVINFLAVNYKIKVSYFMVNLLPLFASVLEPIWSLPALPYIIFSSLSNYSAYYEIPYQYATYFVPQIFIAYIMGITKIKHKKRIVVASFIISISYFALFNLLSPFVNSNLWTFIFSIHSRAINYLNIIRNLIPNNVSILTINNLFPHYANDINAYVIPYYAPYSAFTEKLNVTYILITANGDIWGSQQGMIKALTQNYGLLVDIDGIYLFMKNYTGPPILKVPINMTLPATSFYLISGSPVRIEDMHGEIVYYWPPNASGPVFWFGPYLILMPGSYKATVYLMITRPCNGTLLTLDVANNYGTQILTTKTVSCSMFPKPNEWIGVPLQFNLTTPALSIEIRGLNPTGISGVYFKCVVLNQITTTK
ncbi:hypothetical protein JCM14467A_10740 [Vulcanisaeta sp. JCM 14467]